MPTMAEVLDDQDYDIGTVWRINDPAAPQRHGAIVMKVATTTRPVMTILESVPGGPRRGDSWSSCEIPVEPVTMEIDRRPVQEYHRWWLDEAASIHRQNWLQVLPAQFTAAANPGPLVSVESVMAARRAIDEALQLRANHIWRMDPVQLRDGDERPEDTDERGPI